MYDNKTESMRTINLLQRMNIYQEVFLSILYRVLPIQVRGARCLELFTDDESQNLPFEGGSFTCVVLMFSRLGVKAAAP